LRRPARRRDRQRRLAAPPVAPQSYGSLFPKNRAPTMR
jgi:hypothetical protein